MLIYLLWDRVQALFRTQCEGVAERVFFPIGKKNFFYMLVHNYTVGYFCHLLYDTETLVIK